MSQVVAAEAPRSNGRRLWKERPAYNPKPPTAPVSQPLERRQSSSEDAIPQTNGLHQSASDVNLPTTVHTADTNGQAERGGLKRVMSETSLPFGLDSTPKLDIHVKQEEVNPQHAQRKPSRLSKQVPKVAVSKYAVTEGSVDTKLAELPKAHINGGKDHVGIKSKSSSSLSNLARRSSWIIGSRSPSPSSRKSWAGSETKVEKSATSKKVPPPIDLPEPLGAVVLADGELSPVKRRGTFSNSKVKRPLSAILGSNTNPAVPSIPKSYSTDRLPTIKTFKSKQEMPVLPAPLSLEQLQAFVPETPRKKDELWSVFRALDGEYSKFNSKPGTLKANIIRSSLLPFLRTYLDHPANRSLRAEDLDRRVNILNKWWTGLLEMLNGRNGQSVSPNDRPAVLDGLTGIMVRPEWRLSMAEISSRADRHRPSAKSQSHTSLESTASDFLAESVLHNVRSLFVQNLLSQMAFVVDRMSLKTVPASVAAFCGKVTAYAFFFCPGVADVLVRLWGLPQSTLRRVLDEANVPRNSNLKATTEQIAKYFPAHLRHLTFTSLPVLIRNLRSKSPQSLTLDYIPWYGPWIGRWTGRDSELFFGFAKHYHVLLCEMLPERATLEERITAPCSVLVQAQLLAVLDATIHRGSALAHAEAPQSVTFDDILGADASANPLPVQAPNTGRLMAENRLIMLLRDFLSTSTAVSEVARGTFAALYGGLLKAAAKRTSLHDHEACFILCDFLEESMFILERYYRGTNDPASFLDWDFWFGVLKRLGDSNNTMTEVRLYAFVYSLWGFIAKDQAKKRDICLNWLLEENFSYKQFNHWCPMVRAYYQRLLVWRVGRCDGDPTDIDLEIYETLLSRLTTFWDHFLYRQTEAKRKGEKPPSTAPATPAPSRRLLIVRDDSVPTPGAIFSALIASEPHAYEKYTSLETLNHLNDAAAVSESSSSKSSNNSNNKKRWTFLRSINPFSSSNVINEDPKPLSTTSTNSLKRDSVFPSPPTRTSSTVSPPTRNSSSTSSSSNQSDFSRSSSSTPGTPGTPPQTVNRSHRSFKFALEWIDRSVTLRDRKLFTPQLPHTSRAILQRDAEESETRVRPNDKQMAVSKYSGIALAEWAALVGECQAFYERRRIEGVISPRFVETPTLGVETFRKPIG